MHKCSNCDIIKYVTPCLYHTLWRNGWCDIIKVRLYALRKFPKFKQLNLCNVANV